MKMSKMKSHRSPILKKRRLNKRLYGKKKGTPRLPLVLLSIVPLPKVPMGCLLYLSLSLLYLCLVCPLLLYLLYLYFDLPLLYLYMVCLLPLHLLCLCLDVLLLCLCLICPLRLLCLYLYLGLLVLCLYLVCILLRLLYLYFA